LYEITLTSERDAMIVRSSGAEALLRGSNSYLVTGSDSVSMLLRQHDIEHRTLRRDFHSEEWLILTHEDPSRQAQALSLSVSSREQIVFEDYLIVKGDVAQELADARIGSHTMEFPEYDVPIEYARPQALYIDLPELDLIDSLLSLVSRDSVEAYVRRLEMFSTRYSYSDSIIAARDWLAEKFTQFGCETVIDSFYRDSPEPFGGYLFNVVADHTGTTAQDVLIILCAHYDSIASDSDPFFLAPGADDNASGTAFCLEIARVLQGFDTPKTVRFICFSGEEQGLLGSSAYVRDHPGQNIEVVINADMIAYTAGGLREVNVFRNPVANAHADFVAENINKYTTLLPLDPGNTGRSDHVPFQQAGYRGMFLHEAIFNSVHYHKSHDQADYLDFEYMTEIVTGCAIATYGIATAPPPVSGLTTFDPGTGDELLVRWDLIDDSRSFHYEIMVGVSPGVYHRSFSVPSGENSLIVDKLTEGTRYYVSAKAVVGDSLESIAHPEVTEKPVSPPYPASGLTAVPALRAIELQWERSPHADIVGYKVFRSVRGEDDFTNIVTLNEDSWSDYSIIGDHYYEYFVTAVDRDSNESVSTDTIPSRGAFFDRDLLVVIRPPLGVVGDTAAAMSNYRYMLADIRYDCILIKDETVPIEELGQYRSVFWINEGYPRLSGNLSALAWVSSYGTNLLLCGPLIADELATYGSGWFGLSEVNESYVPDFLYASGEDGWPDATLDSSVKSTYNFYGATSSLSAVNFYDHDTQVSTAIYLFQSEDTTSEHHREPCGIYAEVDSSSMILLGFPIFHVEARRGRAVINRVADLFGVPRDVAGDINDDRRQNLVDCVMMLKILYRDYPMPDDVNRLDVNGDCIFDLVDVMHLLTYIYLGGPDPTYGCMGSG
jgi:hypothetical protein